MGPTDDLIKNEFKFITASPTGTWFPLFEDIFRQDIINKMHSSVILFMMALIIWFIFSFIMVRLFWLGLIDATGVSEAIILIGVKYVSDFE